MSGTEASLLSQGARFAVNHTQRLQACSLHAHRAVPLIEKASSVAGLENPHRLQSAGGSQLACHRDPA